MIIEGEKKSYLEPIDDTDTVFHPETPLHGGVLEKVSHPDATTEKIDELRSHDHEIYQQILSKTENQSELGHDKQSIAQDAQKISQEIDGKTKIQQLVDLAMNKGVAHAVNVAKHMDDFYVLDQVHDSLANNFYDALVEKKLIDRE